MIPAPVKVTPVQRPMLALQEHLRKAGYRVDAIAELEVIDDELRRIVEGFDRSPLRVH